MKPQVSLARVAIRRAHDRVIAVPLVDGVEDESSARTLSPLASRLVALADGTREVDELRAAVGSASTELWAAFDELADIGLLDARVTPPVGDAPAWGATTNRRRVLRQAGVAAGIIVGTGLAGASRVAASAANQEEQQKQNTEKDAKEAQEKAERDAARAKAQEERRKEHAERDQKEDAGKAEHQQEKAEQDAKEALSKEQQEQQRKEVQQKEQTGKGG